MNNPNKIIFHCSDSDLMQHDHIEVIKRWHLIRGFDDVGYHFFIQRDGTVQIGRNLKIIGAHCKGQNIDSIGICLHGKNYFDQRQFDTSIALAESLCISFKIPLSEIYGHRDFNRHKTCPNFDVNEEIKPYILL